MTTIVDWVMTLGFLEKKAWGKKNHGKIFQEGKLWRFLTFFLSSFSDSGTGPSRDRDEIVLLNNWTSGKGNFCGIKNA